MIYYHFLPAMSAPIVTTVTKKVTKSSALRKGEEREAMSSVHVSWYSGIVSYW